MNESRPAKFTIAVATCPRCPDIHLVIFDKDGVVTHSIPMTRAEWAGLIGTYITATEIQDALTAGREPGHVH